MRQVVTKIRPASGFSHFLHLLYVVLLPLLLYVFVRINLAPLAVGLIVLSKWRMFAVRPRHWIANIRVNSVDIIMGISVVIFMTQTSTSLWQLIWAVAYALWLLLIKPGTSTFAVSAQALLAQTAGLMAVYLAWGGASLYILVLATWVICYSAAQHFFTNFDEQYTHFLSDLWGYFGAALAWVLGHWMLYYSIVAQPVLLLSVIGFGLAAMYYLESNDRLSTLLRRQFVFIMIAIIIVVLIFSDWGDKAI